MGAASSKIEEDKALLLCRERKRFVRQALDGRYLLAAAQLGYIQSLRNTGSALRKFVEPEAPQESSLYTTSTSATPEPLTLTDKSTSQFSNSPPSLSQHVETSEPFSPIPSPLSSGRFQVNHMRAGRSSARTIEERLPVPLTATVQTSSATPKHSESHSDENFSSETPPPPGTPPWDYFGLGLFHPIDRQFSFEDGKVMTHGLDNADHIKRLREEEGIPELEEEGEKASSNGRDDDYVDSEDDFDRPSTEPLVRIFRNRNEVSENHSANLSPPVRSAGSIASEGELQNGEKTVFSNSADETDEASEAAPFKTASSVIVLPMNGKEKENGSENKLVAKDLFSCIKEIDDLFAKAAESGGEVLRMLEANKMQFRPLIPEETAQKSKASLFLTSCFSCCTEEAELAADVDHSSNGSRTYAAPAPNDIKYLTWGRSVSSLSSSSRIPVGATSKDDVEDFTSNRFPRIYMNSGSHALTLERLYAWERKLYDEVKASGIIRREYDMKRELLREQESREQRPYKSNRIDKTRASVKDLHSRIRVAIHRIDSISKTIEELRDKELQPQLEELIGGLKRMWVMMLDCHKHQYSIISVASNNGGTKVSVRPEAHRHASVLEFELNSLRACFTKWISTHKSYLQAINGWLLKCVFLLPQQNKSLRRKNQPFSPGRDLAPPIFITCREWLKLLDDLPAKDVADAIKDLVDVTAHFLPRQEKDHGNSISAFSLPRRGVERDEELHRNDTPVDWSLNYDTLQSRLVVLLDRLKSFAEVSVSKYEDLQQTIDKARSAYEEAGSRP